MDDSFVLEIVDGPFICAGERRWTVHLSSRSGFKTNNADPRFDRAELDNPTPTTLSRAQPDRALGPVVAPGSASSPLIRLKKKVRKGLRCMGRQAWAGPICMGS